MILCKIVAVETLSRAETNALNAIVPSFGTIVPFICRLTWIRIDKKIETSPWTEWIPSGLLILDDLIANAFNIITTHSCSIVTWLLKDTSVDSLTSFQSTDAIDIISACFAIICFPWSIWIWVCHCTSELFSGRKITIWARKIRGFIFFSRFLSLV